MYDDSKRYENDGLYDEDTDYEDEYGYEYEAVDSDYIVDDEDEDENALWDDTEEDAADKDDSDEPPEKTRRKRKKEAAFTDVEDAEAEEYERTRRRLAKEQRIIDEIEADAAENPIEDEGDDTGDEQPERKLLKRELQAQALKRLEDSAQTLRDYENLVAWYDRLDANRQRKERYHELYRSGDDVPLTMEQPKAGCTFPTLSTMCCPSWNAKVIS